MSGVWNGVIESGPRRDVLNRPALEIAPCACTAAACWVEISVTGGGATIELAAIDAGGGRVTVLPVTADVGAELERPVDVAAWAAADAAAFSRSAAECRRILHCQSWY